MNVDLVTYATIMAELAEAPETRDAVLARHRLDDASFHAVDSHWQKRLSEDMVATIADVPALLTQYTEAYAAAQRELSAPISIEQFARVTRLLQASGDVQAALAKVGVSFADYVRGSEHWSKCMVADPDVERQFREALRGT